MLPDTGFLRLPQIIGCRKRGLPALIPVSRATWFRGIEAGRYPAGVLLGPQCRAWSVESIRELMGKINAGQGMS